jgi:hypothetical protein
MPIKFKSQATGDLVMVQAHAQALLKVIGKGDASKGILEPADMDTALLAMRALSDDVPGSPEGAQEAEEVKNPAFQDEAVSLRKRAWPLIKMIEEAQAAGKPIVWGV